MLSDSARIRQLEEMVQDFIDGQYPQPSMLGPGRINGSIIKAKSITGSMIDVSNLEAVSTKTGNLTVTGDIVMTTTGTAIRAGLTAFNDITHEGFWLGVDGDTVPKLFVGSNIGATDPRIVWNGTTLEVVGTIKAESGYLKTMTINGALDLNSSGVIKSGKSGYGSGTGIWLEYNGGTPKLDIGSATRYLRWDGSTLTFTGSLSAADGSFSGSLSAVTGTLGNLTVNGTLTLGTGGISSTNFGLTSSGVMTASSANVSGTLTTGALTATGGTIGGLTIGSSDITIGSGKKLRWNGGSNWIDSSLIHIELPSSAAASIEWAASGVNRIVMSAGYTSAHVAWSLQGFDNNNRGGYFDITSGAADSSTTVTSWAVSSGGAVTGIQAYANGQWIIKNANSDELWYNPSNDSLNIDSPHLRLPNIASRTPSDTDSLTPTTWVEVIIGGTTMSIPAYV